MWFFLTIINISYSLTASLTLEQYHEELFGSGEFRPSLQRQKATTKHMSSSTEDLITLFNAEKDFIHLLKSNSWNHSIKTEYLNSIDYDETTETVEYVYHPINAYHLLSRIVRYIPKLKYLDEALTFNSSFKLEEAVVREAAYGLSNLAEITSFSTEDWVIGKLRNYVTGQEFVSSSPLTTKEAMQIATQAKIAHYHVSYVQWCQIALNLAKLEKKSQKELNHIRKTIANAMAIHDDFFLKSNPYNLVESIRETPYKPSVLTEDKMRDMARRRKKMSNNFDNLIENSPHFNAQIPSEIAYKLKSRIQGLCRGDYQRPAKLEIGLKCVLLHHDNPYLKLGPFKLEYLHNKPEIAILRQFLDNSEIEPVKDLAKGKMISTPYVVKDKENLYSKFRTSKVCYFNELHEPEVMKVSRKINLATGFLMKDEQYASENYQVMNYGIGGRISVHVDSRGGHSEIRESSSEKDMHGGHRISTFMIYLSTVIAGGHTVFPQAGIHVQPVEGDALYWFNLGSHFTYDSRILHMGCPVTYGNKWIANKWVKILPQFRKYPCGTKESYFSVNSGK